MHQTFLHLIVLHHTLADRVVLTVNLLILRIAKNGWAFVLDLVLEYVLVLLFLDLVRRD